MFTQNIEHQIKADFEDGTQPYPYIFFKYEGLY